MAHYLPMFPLNLIVFPGEQRGLYIFEERYKELIHECDDSGITFGIPVVINNQLAPIGTEVRLVSIDEVMAGGEMQITIEGLKRFRIITFKQKARNRLYPAGEVDWLDHTTQADTGLQHRVSKLINTLHRLLENVKSMNVPPEELHTFDIGHDIGLSFEQQYRLLSLNTENERLQYIQNHLEQELQKLKAKFNGHFENYTLPDM
ncbi:MAG: peptidase S16 [Bacteroidetes bacterium]|nr:MAG: peptidase S16 [Bacteroidota bacterium]